MSESERVGLRDLAETLWTRGFAPGPERDKNGDEVSPCAQRMYHRVWHGECLSCGEKFPCRAEPPSDPDWETEMGHLRKLADDRLRQLNEMDERVNRYADRLNDWNRWAAGLLKELGFDSDGSELSAQRSIGFAATRCLVKYDTAIVANLRALIDEYRDNPSVSSRMDIAKILGLIVDALGGAK